jgi:hypothetical protein
MEEPKRDDAAEQKARNEENKQEAKQLLESHRQDELLAPGMFLRILEVYLLFVAAVVGIGVLAFYSHHDTTSAIFFIASVLLVLIAPVAVIWYLLVRFKKNVAIRISQSSIGAAVLRSVRNRKLTHVIFLFGLVASSLMIVFAIIRFPLHPRLSLAISVYYMTSLLISVTLQIVNSLESRLRVSIRDIWKFAERNLDLIETLSEAVQAVDTKAEAAIGLAESSHKYMTDIEPLHAETHKQVTIALNAIQHDLEGWAKTSPATPPKGGAPDPPAGEDDQPGGKEPQ